MLGLGVMIRQLAGGSEHSASEYYGKIIKKVELVDDALIIEFKNKKRIKLSDNGQSCCEHRYMTTDDDLKYVKGAKLIGIELKESEDMLDERSDVHEICFLEIQTDKGCVTFVNHNEHNGYYGGFSLEIQELN